MTTPIENKVGTLEKVLGKNVADVKQNKDSLAAHLADNTHQASWMIEAFSGLRFIGHRGFSTYYPENTLKAYVEADREGFFGWEFDPIVISDGTWVNMHDDTVDRTTNGTGNVTAFTLSDLKALNIDGGNNTSLYPLLKVPTIDEILNLASHATKPPVLFFNNRTSTPIDGVNTISLVALIKKYNYEKRSIVFCDMSNFLGVRKLLPSIGVCHDFGTTAPTQAQLDSLVAYAPNVMAAIDRTVLQGGSGASVIQMCKDRNILITAHNTETDKDIISLKNMGVNAIITGTTASI